MDIQFYHEESTSLYISKVRKETFVTSLYDSTQHIRFNWYSPIVCFTQVLKEIKRESTPEPKLINFI